MSTLINLAANTITNAGLFDILTNGVAVLWVALLLILIIEKVLLDANGQRTSAKRTIAFDIAIGDESIDEVGRIIGGNDDDCGIISIVGR